MTPISPADVTRLRTARHSTSLVLNAAPLVEVASAQINQYTFAYPLGELTVDNTSDDWLTAVQVGQAFSIGTTPGSHDIKWGVVRKTPTATTFYPNALTLGDPGHPRNLIGGIDNDLYLTVWKHRPLWGHLSAIRNKKFYKAWDVAYTDEGSNPNPMARLGLHRYAEADAVTGKASLTFSAANSYAWGSKTITGYSWDIDGGTLTGGTLTSSSLTAEFEPGWYVITCTVTDSGSKAHTGFRYLWVAGDDYTPFGASHAWEITGDDQDRGGRKVNITFTGYFDEDDFYPGQAFLLVETPLFGGEALEDADAFQHTFLGYLTEMDTEQDGYVPSVRVKIESPYHVARRLPAAPQQMAEKSSPANWTQVTSTLSNVVGAAWYIMQHHAPALLAGHDFEFNDTLKSLRKQSFAWQQDSIGQQLDALKALGQFAGLGSRSDGTLVFQISAVHLATQDERNALESKFTWNANDITSPLRRMRQLFMPVSEVRGDAFAYGGGSQATPYRSRAAGDVVSQGVGSSSFTCVVTTDQGQDGLNILTGHQYAQEVAEVPTFETELSGNLDIADPTATNVWHTFAIPTVFDPFEQQWVSRALPLRVRRRWEMTQYGLVKDVTIEWQPDFFGQPGVTVPIERGAAGSQVQRPVKYEPKIERAFALPWDASGNAARTFNFHSDIPAWGLLSETIAGSVNEVTLDYDSDFFTTGLGALGAWLVTTEGTTLRIYYVTDVRAPLPAPVLLATFTMADSTVTTSARIASSRTTPGFVVAAWRSRTGTRVVRSTDAGINWGSAITVGDTASDADADNADIGLAVDGVNQLVTARDTDGDYYLYLATSTGGSFAKVTGSPASSAPYPMIVVDGQGRAYCRTIEAEGGADIEVTFDTGGWTSYTVNVGTEEAYGNPGDCVRVTSALGNGGTINVCIDFGGTYSIRRIEVDCYIKWDGTTTPSTLRWLTVQGKGSGGCAGTLVFNNSEITNLALVASEEWEVVTNEPTTPNSCQSLTVSFNTQTGTYGGANVYDTRIDNIRIYFE